MRLSNATGHAVSHVGPKDRTAPVRRLLASQVTKILLLPGSSWLIVVRQSQPTTSALMASKVYWWFMVQGGNVVLHSFFVSSVRRVVCSANWGRNAVMYLTIPRNCRTCFADLGIGQFKICSTLLESASIPFADMWWPRKSISVAKSFDFLSEQYNWAFLSASKTSATFVLCSARVDD